MSFQDDLDAKEIRFRQGDLLVFLTDRMVDRYKHGKGSAKISLDPETEMQDIARGSPVDHSLIARSGMKTTTDRQQAELFLQSLVPCHLPYAWDARRLTDDVILIEMWRD